MDNIKRRLYYTQLSIGLVTLLLMVLNICRIVKVGITHDEGITHKDYLGLSYADIIAFKNSTANNHILNTLLSKLSINTFTDTPFFLRLDNLLAQLFFMLFAWLTLCRVFKDKLIVLLSFIILNLNPFLFEFWGLCRGYGLSLSLMMASIYFLVRYLPARDFRFLCLSLVFAVASVYSNFSLLHFYLGLIFVIVCNALFINKTVVLKLREIDALLIASLLLALLIAYPIKYLILTGQLYYGGETSFIHDTIRSLVSDSFFLPDSHTVLVSICSYLIVAAISLMALACIRLFSMRYVTGTHQLQIVFTLLLLIPILSTVLQFHLAGAKLLISRTALFFIPLFLLAFLLFHESIKSKLKYLLPAIICVVGIVNFCVHLNFNKSYLWPDDRFELPAIVKMLNEHGQGKEKIRLRPSWQFVPSFQYYAETKYNGSFYGIDHNKELPGADTSFDYYFVYKEEVAKLSPIYKIDTTYDDKYVLLRKQM